LRGVSASLLQGFSELQIQGTVSNNSDDVDLAAIVVDEDLDGRHPSARFFELVPGGQAPTVGESVFAWGFPRDLLRTTSQQGTVAFIYGHWSEVSANGKEISTFNPDLHFAAPFVEESPQAHPMGLSGSVQWFRRPTPPPALWTTNLDVGGVTITYDNPSRLLKMVRREVVERFLSAHFS
jgi:hypothetical protein